MVLHQCTRPLFEAVGEAGPFAMSLPVLQLLAAFFANLAHSKAAIPAMVEAEAPQFLLELLRAHAQQADIVTRCDRGGRGVVGGGVEAQVKRLKDKVRECETKGSKPVDFFIPVMSIVSISGWATH
jgi:hypothetical protein